MGGCQSSRINAEGQKKIAPVIEDKKKGGATNRNTFKMIVNEKCPHIRVDCSKEIRVMKVVGDRYDYCLSYCYVSQRGYYPHALNKANQDSYVICEGLLGNSNAHLFGIFDGHGEYGDFCSHYCASEMPPRLMHELQTNYNGLASFSNTKTMEEVYSKSFTKTNEELHNSTIDDSLSGTTGITAVIIGDCLYVANVGDSRAIIASEDEPGKVIFQPLSSDQTPYRRDERERVKLKGARVLTLEQIEGNEPIHENWGSDNGESIDEVGDPPRIWDSSLERPGCAFTRSLGDLVAEQVGVMAEPEILKWKLRPGDKYIVVASDGVFEFLTSQAVIDILGKFDDIIKGAKMVIAESYRLWLTYDDRTDDISLIVISLSEFSQRKKEIISPNSDSKADLDNVSSRRIHTKPVRLVMSKARRKIISEKKLTDDATAFTEFDLEANTYPKTAEELTHIEDILHTNFMFSHLSATHKDMIAKVMKLRIVKEGELIIKEGDPGDEMYVVNSGEFLVFKRDENGILTELLRYTTPGCAFGELSLMYGEPRAASIRALTAGSLWTIGRLVFRSIIMNKRHKGLLVQLRALPLFKDLPFTKLQRLCDASSEESCGPDSPVPAVTADWMVCMVISGQVRLTSKDRACPDKVLEAGSCFACTEMQRNWSDSRAIGTTAVLCIPKSAMREFLTHQPSERPLSVSQQVPVQRDYSIFRSGTENYQMDIVLSRDDLILQHTLFAVGDGEFAFIGNFLRKKDQVIRSVKVVAKLKAKQHGMEKTISTERMLLASVNGSCAFLPRIISTFQDSRILMMVYEERFVCDLATAAQQEIAETTKKYVCAALFKAFSFLHMKGIMHRLLNPYSVYITASGIPMLSDMSYAKLMDGSQAYTNCGDPLYLAPEMIAQQGYDYSVDIWAFGVIMYELFEGKPPFGREDSDKTTLFNTITAFRTGEFEISFSKCPAAARDLISLILVPDAPGITTGRNRIGYKDSYEIKSHRYFSDIDWPNMERSFPAGLGRPSAGDPKIAFNEGELEVYNSEDFAMF